MTAWTGPSRDFGTGAGTCRHGGQFVTGHGNLNPRAATLADVPGISACVDSAYRPYISRVGKRPGPMLEDYRQVVTAHRAYVTEASDGITGVLVLKETQDGLLLDNIAVHPSHQGKGAGADLVRFAESEACRLGYGCLSLYTHQRMTENISWYRRLGYREAARRTEHGFARVYLCKNLSA